MGFRRFGTPRSVGSAVRAVTPPPSTPAEILTGMVLEMDAANIDGIGDVSTWYGNAIQITPDVDQFDSVHRATWNVSDADFNSEPTAVFSGNDAASAKYYETNALTGLTEGEVWAVLACDYDFGSGWPGVAYTGLWTMGTSVYVTQYSATNGHILDGFGSDTRKDYGDQSSLPIAEPHIYNVSSTAGEYIARCNGVTVYSTATNTAAFPSTARVGSSSGGSVVFNGRLAYLVVCDQVQSPTARAQMNTYLSQRFAITLP